MSKPRRGFTLVELLAVIVILAVILVIAVPSIMSTITESRKGALASSAKLIASSAETKKVSNDTLGINKTITCKDVSSYTEEDYDSCTITFDSNGKAKVTIVGKGKFEGMSVCSATKEDAEISSECTTDVSCFTYDETETGISITGYSDTCSKDVIIPSKIDNKSVVYIGEFAFWDHQLTSVTIPDSVTSIGRCAFRNNQLTSVKIPNSVTIISSGAFNGNQLTSITIPDSVTLLGGDAFFGNQLTEVNFPNTPLTLQCDTFAANPIYDTLEYPSNVTINCNPPA